MRVTRIIEYSGENRIQGRRLKKTALFSLPYRKQIRIQRFSTTLQQEFAGIISMPAQTKTAQCGIFR
ncbi:hypothetical protein MS5786_18860 [Klebsiella pneumoniae]|nr:hypothetical protein NUBL13791_49180 [Klebsiella pneumoniae]GKL34867.1 hypothetical protein NUBL13798_50340 [Klebsiella pneumoniae]GKN71103.1 hypothetical protein MS5786_18860 [Klebsiella pneumoniae]CDL59674.1 hypothetical protein [Klebsiella pneumoniae IS39]